MSAESITSLGRLSGGVVPGLLVGEEALGRANGQRRTSQKGGERQEQGAEERYPRGSTQTHTSSSVCVRQQLAWACVV